MLPSHVSVHHLHVFYNVCQEPKVQPKTVTKWQGYPSSPELQVTPSALLQAGGVLAVVHAAEGDVDDGDQTLGGAQRAEQPVGVGFAQDSQDVALVEAQLAGLGRYVVAQGSDFTLSFGFTRAVRCRCSCGLWVTG